VRTFRPFGAASVAGIELPTGFMDIPAQALAFLRAQAAAVVRPGNPGHGQAGFRLAGIQPLAAGFTAGLALLRAQSGSPLTLLPAVPLPGNGWTAICRLRPKGAGRQQQTGEKESFHRQGGGKVCSNSPRAAKAAHSVPKLPAPCQTPQEGQRRQSRTDTPMLTALATGGPMEMLGVGALL